MSIHPLDRDDDDDLAATKQAAATSTGARISRAGWLIVLAGLVATLWCTVAGGGASQQWAATTLAKLATLLGALTVAFGYRHASLLQRRDAVRSAPATKPIVRGDAARSAAWSLPLLWLAVLVVLAANFLGTILMANGPPLWLAMELMVGLMCLMLGMFQAEAGLVGLWLAGGSPPLHQRIPNGLLALFLAWCSWMVAIEWYASPAPPAIWIGAGGILAVTAALTAVACWLGRQLIGDSSGPRSRGDKPITIRTLMTWIVLAAVASLAVRLLVAGRTWNNSLGPPATMTAVFAVVFCAAGVALATAAASLVYADRMPRGVLLFVFFLAAAPVLVAIFLPLLVGSLMPWEWRFAAAILCYCSGVFVPTAVIVALERWFRESRPAEAPPLSMPQSASVEHAPITVRERTTRYDLAMDD